MARKIRHFALVAQLVFPMPAYPFSSLLLNGRVTDSEGATVKRAHILLHTDFAGGWSKVSYDANAITDRSGTFTFNIGTGFYDLCVMADAFTPECRKVFIEDHSVQQNFRLKISPEVSKRIADKF